MNPASLAKAITWLWLGGRVVTEAERDSLPQGHRFYNIAAEPVSGETVYNYGWVVQMVVAGRSLRRDGFLMETEDEPEVFSQVIN